jgi:ATP-dependent Lon protease
MNRPRRIPLFPLDVVLFPGVPLPLHIFEPRYKKMTQRCLDERLEFGVVLGRAEGIAAVGCTAEITEVTKRYPDGRMDIHTVGRSRCRIAEVFEGKPYLEAQVEYLDDEPSTLDDAERLKLVVLYEQCHTLLFGRRNSAFDPAPELPLSYQVAGTLPLEIEYRQSLLESLSEADRRADLLEHLKKWLPHLTRLEKTRKKAGGNGHGFPGHA